MSELKDLVLDTSVILKWFRSPDSEPDTPQAHALRDSFLNGDLVVHVPDLLVYEFGNVLRSRGRLKLNSAQDAMQALWDLGIEIVPTDPQLCQTAMKLAYERNLTFLDASFLALAHHLGTNLITADESLFKKIGH